MSAREDFDSEQLDRLQLRVQALEKASNGNPLVISGGVLLTEEPGAVKRSGIVFVGGTQRSIPHGLGRKAVGFFEVCAADVASANNCRLHTAASTSSAVTSSTHITVMPTNSGNVFLFVF